MAGSDECTSRCRSVQHGDELASVLACMQLEENEVAAYLAWKCGNYTALHDSVGRGLIHVAACSGRLNLLRHFLQRRDCLNECSPDSGYSVLHYCAYYGQVHCAVRLIQLGADVGLTDHGYLTPMEIILKDLRKMRNSPYKPWDAYVWGTNNNYTLGIGHNRERQLPEAHEFFRKKKSRIMQVSIQKFHTIYLDGNGVAWSCGHGAGGRLGHGNEAPSLEPKKVNLPEKIKCTHVSIGEDHTLLLTDSGVVWACGSNNYNQLGLSNMLQNVLSPKPIKSLPSISGVSAAHHHSIFWTNNQLYACGLNEGQLGYASDANDSPAPRPITSLKLKDVKITSVSTCPVATAVLAGESAIYLFHNYRCTRITSRDCNFIGKKIVVAASSNDGKQGADSAEVRLAVLTAFQILIWRGSSEKFLPATYSVRHEIIPTDVAFTYTGCMISTIDGSAYLGYLRDLKKGRAEEFMDLKSLPHIHRASNVVSDPRGNNFAILQDDPCKNLDHTLSTTAKSRTLRSDLADLLEETSEDDAVHDVVFKVEGQRFAAHKFIVFMGNDNTTMKKVLDETPMADTMEIKNISANAFRCILRYIYSMNLKEPVDKRSETDQISAYEAYNSKKKATLKVSDVSNSARRLGVNGVLRELSGDSIKHKSLNRKAGQYDTTLIANDGSRVRVHKCVLVARMEYFRIMLTHGWRESKEAELTVPVSGRILEVMVNYLYTDTSSDVTSSEDLTFLSEVLVAADQFICMGLKTLAEVALAHLINLRSAVTILQLSVTYNAEFLNKCTQEFICDNLVSFLEDRSLEALTDESLEGLSTLYRQRLPSSRTLPCNYDDLEIVTVRSIAEAFPVTLNLDEEIARPETKTPKKKEAKKRERKISEQQRLISVESSDEVTPAPTLVTPTPTVVTPAPTLVTTAKKEDDKRTTDKGFVSTPKIFNNAAHNRLNAVVEAAKESEPSSSFSNLGELFLGSDFPEMNSSRPEKSRLSDPGRQTSKPVSIPKLSQKERRRLASASSPTETTVVCRKTWATIPPPESVCDARSPPQSSNLTSIIDSELKERERAQRLRNKPLTLTQLEDRAIQELRIFYNADGAVDERITVSRLDTTVVAAPIWVANRSAC